MPVKSARQFRFMEAAKSGNLRGTGGPSPAVAQEFLQKTPKSTKSKFAKENKFANAFVKKKKKPSGVQEEGEEESSPF